MESMQTFLTSPNVGYSESLEGLGCGMAERFSGAIASSQVHFWGKGCLTW
jgi:hypothetical protein